MRDPYVVLAPKGRGNPTDMHLVVRAGEWAAMFLGVITEYPDAHEHDDYDDAAARRDELNAKEKTPA